MKGAKDCPFCGSEDLRVENDKREDPWWQISCFTCGALGPSADSSQDAVERWNLRMDFGPEDPLKS